MNFLEKIKNPPREFSPAAFWFWYGVLDPEKLRKQINMMVEQGVYNGFMHARAYLKTQYLEEDWWKAISACIDESQKVGFYPWLYDEYAWPSGTAGSTFKYGYQKPSRTLSEGEKNQSKFIIMRKYSSYDEFKNNDKKEKLIAVFKRENNSWKYTPDVLEANGEIMAFYCGHSPRFVDYLNPETIKEFISYTHEEYKKRFGEYFGNVVPGIFFDEIFMVGWMPWTERFADEFKKRCGYDIIPNLYALEEVGGEEERKIRNDYYSVVAQLYEETFFVQISDWCRENNLDLTGHIEEHFALHPARQGQFFNNMRHLDIPGADCHDYRYRFPRKITYREPKFSVSTARLYGKKRAMSEALGGAGWGCSLQQFKRGINTLGAMGISMITLHGFYSECESQGEQADWPSSFFFQNPYWRYFKYFADYINRICYMNTQGTPVVEVGLYYPVNEMRMLTINGTPSPKAKMLDTAWNNAMNSLIENQIDVDMVDETSILNAEISNERMCVGVQKFRILVCPDIMQPSAELAEKLEQFVQSGGKIIYYACDEECKEGVLNPLKLPNAVNDCFAPDIKVICGARDNLYVNHRIVEGKDVYMVANSAPRARSLTIGLRERGSVKKLSPENGKLSDIMFSLSDSGTKVHLSLEADEACWLVLNSEEASTLLKDEVVLEETAVAGKWEFLPISSEIKGAKQLKTESTELQIPLAAFSSKLHPDGRQIRIQNTTKEKGYCGRHLSLWEAKWITRRFDWVDSSMKEELYFRRKINLEEKPQKARICIAAVNKWIMWINGQKAAESSLERVGETIDIARYLTKGENLIAVQVINKTPMEHFNLLSLEYLRPEELISLLAQAEITVGDKTITLCTDEKWEVNDYFHNGWNQPEYKAEKIYSYSTTFNDFGNEDERWTQSWERGCPPLLPWGDLPLFGETISYPQRISYSVILPAGTERLYYPELTGSDVSLTVDGMEMLWENGECVLKPDGNCHQLQIVLTANNEKNGLHSSIRVEVVPFRWALCDWRLHGLKWYSGFARYSNKLTIQKKTGSYLLDLGKVAHQAEVWVNGTWAGDRVWEPYQLDVTDLIKDGENEFDVIVSNSAAVERQFMLVDEGQALGWDRYWNDDNIQREGENLLSGLQGPVMLVRKEN